MPVLFALPGILAANGILRGWKQGTAFRRLVDNYYLHALWATIYFVFFLVLNCSVFPHSVDDAGDFAAQFVIPGTVL